MVWAVVSLVCLLRLAWSGVRPRPTRPCAENRQVDVNRAAIAELRTLPGVGQTRAAAIVLHRVRHGPYRRLEDLLEVEGVGATTLDRLRPHLRDPALPR